MAQVKLKDLCEDILIEFKEDLGKQMIVMMGLPAAGKSTFINLDLPKYFTGFSGYSVTNTDNQIAMMQHTVAKNHYVWLEKNAKTEEDLVEFSKNSEYTTNSGADIEHPITWKWWEANKDKGFQAFFKAFHNKYYLNYFDIRSFAMQSEKTSFDDKIKKAGNYLIIDTTGRATAQLLTRMKTAKNDNYHIVVIYLEMDVKHSIARDKYRGKTGGREVGESVIRGYPAAIAASYNKFKADGKKKDGTVDRAMKFVWKGKVDPRKGKWVKVEDERFALKRRLGK